jgi:hypothetical protein
MVLNKGIPVLRKFMLKNLKKIPFGVGQVQDFQATDRKFRLFSVIDYLSPRSTAGIFDP